MHHHLNKTCSKDHTHAQCTGNELTNTQMYTLQGADVVHQCIARTALSASSPPNLAKVRPALPCARIMPRPPAVGPKAVPKAEFKAPPVVHGPRAEPPPVAHGPRGGAEGALARSESGSRPTRGSWDRIRAATSARPALGWPRGAEGGRRSTPTLATSWTTLSLGYRR